MTADRIRASGVHHSDASLNQRLHPVGTRRVKLGECCGPNFLGRNAMAVPLIRTASLVALLGLGLSAASAQIFLGGYTNNGGILATKPIPVESDSFSDVPSFNLDHSFDQSAPALNSQTSTPVTFTGDVSMHGADRSFGIGVDATINVPAGAGDIINRSGDSLSANVALDDTWFADTQAGARTLRFTGVWNVNGQLAASAVGEAP